MPDDEYGSIEDHPNWPDVVDAIHKYGDWTKEQLVSASYDNSGGTVPPARRIGDRVVRQISQCPLLIDGMYGELVNEAQNQTQTM